MADDFSFRFSSKYLDDETGLYYYGYRYMSPALGRWTSSDPIAESLENSEVVELTKLINELKSYGFGEEHFFLKKLESAVQFHNNLHDNTHNLNIFSFNNALNNHDRDGRLTIVEVVVVVAVLGTLTWAVIKIINKGKENEDVSLFSNEGAQCMMEEAAGGIGAAIDNAGAGYISGKIIDKILNEALQSCVPFEEEAEEYEAKSEVRDIRDL